MTGPLVSILIPAFNAEQWIAATIRSALAQTWEEKEIIIVDDGSRDRTLAIARRYEGDRVRVTTQKNEGAAATRNRAFSLSRGAMIQWLDADDLLSANKIERQMQARLTDSLATAKTLFSCAWGRFFYRESRSEFQPSPLW